MDRRGLLNDAEEGLRVAFDGRQSTVWTAMPAIVQSVNLSAMTVVVQTTIQGIVNAQDNTQTFVNLPPLVDVPICFPSAGGFTITMPIAVGDEVLVVFASRCIDAWWQSGGFQNQPIEFRMHDLSDGFALPGPRSLPRVVPTISSTDLEIRNDAGTSYIASTADGHIKLVSPQGVTVTGNLNVSGTIIGGGISLTTHVHGGVSTGTGDTGGPI